ncbi:MAG: wax ester/triacylglycerol synthase family O-acyltransferase [Nevskiales bacterium]|nr:wax ester/triacylglycerol synthase family O-acyltransferase [Nevskiales bacterium]
MRQLSGLDTLFLNLETNAVPMHVGGLTLIDGRTAPEGFGFEAVKKLIESRLHLLPMYRRRLVTSPLNLDMPYWIEDPEFDIENHVRHRALPRPGNDQQLADFVCDVLSTRLDRSMPLWRIYYIEGVSGGHVALVSKIHHACIDGVSGAEIMGTLLDLTSTPRTVAPPVRPWRPEPVPSPLQLAMTTARHLMSRPGEAIRLLRDTGPALFSAGRAVLAQSRARTTAQKSKKNQPVEKGGLGVAPRTRFNTTITARRAYAYRSLSLPDVKFVKNVFGTSVNDVILGVCAEALRNYLLDKNELPERTLIASVPVSVRNKDEVGQQGNKVSMTRAALCTEIEDPVERLQAISRIMAEAKKALKAVPARRMMDWIDVPAPALLAQAARLYENFSIQDRVAPPFNLVISNVPGPPQPLFLAGARVLANYPTSIPYHGLAFNITVMSYQDNLDVGLTAHRGSVPDIKDLMDRMEAALALLKARAEEGQPPAIQQQAVTVPQRVPDLATVVHR